MKTWYSRKVYNNLMRVYNRASLWDFNEGMRWYTTGHLFAEELSQRYSVSVAGACGIMAALSPGNSWDKNKQDAIVFLQEWSNGARGKKLPLVGSYGWGNIVKASKCAAGINPWEVLGGNKVRAFYACLLDPSNKDWVCVDRHAKGAALGYPLSEKDSTVKNGEYKTISKHYLKCAEKVNILPNQFQAIVWVVWKRLGGLLDQQDIPF